MRTSRQATRAAFATAACLLALGLGSPGAAQSSSSTSAPGSKSADGSSQAAKPGPTGSNAMSNAGGTSSTMITPESRRFIEQAAKSGLKEVRLARLATERAASAEVRDYAQMLLTDHQEANTRLASIARFRSIDLPTEGMVTSTATSLTGTTAVTTRETPIAAATEPRTVVGGQSGIATPEESTAAARTTEASSTTSSGDPRDAVLATIEAEVAALRGKSGAEFDRAFVADMVKDHKKTIELFEEASGRTGDTEVSEFASMTLPRLRAHLARAEALAQRAKR